MQNYASLIEKCRKIVSVFHQSTKLSEYLSEAQKLLNIEQHKLIQDVKTRWNSTYLMIERLYEQLDAINHALTQPDIRRKYEDLSISEFDKDNIMEIIQVFEPFYNATLELSGCKYVTISIVIPAG